VYSVLTYGVGRTCIYLKTQITRNKVDNDLLSNLLDQTRDPGHQLA